MISTGRVSWRARKDFSTCKPSLRGRPRSSSSRSNCSVRNTRSADSPSLTQSTAKPSRRRPVRIASPIIASSSTSSSLTIRLILAYRSPWLEPFFVSIVQRLVQDTARLGVTLTEPDASRLIRLLDELERWNRTYNLTAIRNRDDMLTHHLLDSLSIHRDLRGATVADVGTGAGFPGLPLAMVNPERRFTLIDSNGKKIRFVQHAARELGLDNVEGLHGRVEAIRARSFDTVVARAFAALP